MTIGETLKSAREKLGVSQCKVEDSLGWGRGSLSKYEKDIYSVPDKRKKELFEFYGITSDTFIFKETKTPPPVQDKSPTSLTHNKEGYVDTTMAKALANAMTKYTDPLPGEVWTHYRSSGGVLQKLILAINGSVAYCITIFTKGTERDFKIKCKAGFTYYASFDRMEAIRLRDLKERKSIISKKSFEDVKLHFSALLGIAVVEKEVEVVKKVPVEKEVIKEVIKEIPSEVDKDKYESLKKNYDLAVHDLELYKEFIDRLAPLKG